MVSTSKDQWLSEMRNASLSPDVITYTSLMESLVSHTLSLRVIEFDLVVYRGFQRFRFSVEV